MKNMARSIATFLNNQLYRYGLSLCFFLLKVLRPLALASGHDAFKADGRQITPRPLAQ